MERFFGVDLHRSNFVNCMRVEGKEFMQEWSIRKLDKFASTLTKNDSIAVEATGNTKYFCDAVKDKVGRLVIVNPYQFQVISRSVKKTDTHDAKTLALFLEKEMLPEVRMKDEDQAKISSMVQTRDKMVKLRTVLKNKINNICARYAVILKKESMSSEKGLKYVEGISFDTVTDIEIKVITDQIRALNKSITDLDSAIVEHGKKLEGFENIISIKGVGEKSAAILLSAIGDVNDFRNSGKLASYFGIVPRVQNSGDSHHHGRITRKGNKLARTTLVQCVLIAKRYSPYLESHYQRIKNRRGAPKAIIALARKFLDIIYKTLKNKWIFADFPNFKLVSQ